jgi:hypothetical protein
MKIITRTMPLIAGLLALLFLGAACGKKEEKAGGEPVKKQAAKETGTEVVSLDAEAPEIRAIVERTGYKARSYVKFPAQEVGKKGRIVLYENGRSGGVIYLIRTKHQTAPGWHWFFADRVPEAVEPVELNEDGLWDIRVTAKDGGVVQFVQDDSFTLTAGERSDWLAMNGMSSDPSTGDETMWKCFDGDSTTAWRSSFASNENVFLEFQVPFGVEEGILTIRTMSYDQPRVCTLMADGKRIQQITFEAKEAVQTVRLDTAIKGAKALRLVFESSYGKGEAVSIAELALR